MPKYRLTNKAAEDLSGILDYTAETWSENQAIKHYDMLLDFCDTLAEHPLIGKHYAGISKDLLGFRTNKHIIFYKIISDGEIEVVRILRGQMDLENRIDEL